MSAWPEVVQFNRVSPRLEHWEGESKPIFMIENQAVCLWAADDDTPTAAVWIRENEPRRPWQREGEPLDAFLLQVAVFEQVMSGEHAGIAIDFPHADLDRALALLTPLPWRPWSWPADPTAFYVGDRALAMVTPTAGAGSDRVDQFQLAALDAEGLAPFTAIVGDWSYLSERDRDPD
jgi:hypothetical protein